MERKQRLFNARSLFPKDSTTLFWSQACISQKQESKNEIPLPQKCLAVYRLGEEQYLVGSVKSF